MALADNSYGTVGGVSGLVPRFTNPQGNFDGNTRPSFAQIEGHIDEVSAILNAMLSDEGFAIPAVQSDMVLALNKFVHEEVAGLCEGVNGYGRFGPQKRGEQSSRFRLISEDVQNFIDIFASGWERMGAERVYGEADGVGSRGTDEQGDEVFPMFQRKGFHDADYRKNWDS